MDPLDDWEDALELFRQRTVDMSGQSGFAVPPDLKGRMPFRLFYVIDGTDDGVTQTVLVGMDVFAADYTTARSHAGLARQRFIAAPWVATVNGRTTVVDRVSTSRAPREVDWGDTDVRRMMSEFTVSYRR